MPKIRFPNRIGKCYRLYYVPVAHTRSPKEYNVPEGCIVVGSLRHDLYGKTVMVIGKISWRGNNHFELLVSKANGESEIVYIDEYEFAAQHAYRHIKQIR